MPEPAERPTKADVTKLGKLEADHERSRQMYLDARKKLRASKAELDAFRIESNQVSTFEKDSTETDADRAASLAYAQALLAVTALKSTDREALAKLHPDQRYELMMAKAG